MVALAVEVEQVGDGNILLQTGRGLPSAGDGGMLAGLAYHASFGLFERQECIDGWSV
jgi:hypothetical protein